MKNLEEIRESTSNEYKKQCLNYVRGTSGEMRVNEIISYFNSYTLHPHVNLTYKLALGESLKPAVEDWQAFSELLIERLLPRAVERAAMREKEEYDQENMK